MNDLFIETFLDEDVDVRVAGIVRSRGFKVVVTNEIGRKGKSDENQLDFAAHNGYAILTHNRVDFEKLAQNYFFEGKKHFGMIIAARHSPQAIAQRLMVILNNLTADEMINQIIYI